MDSSKVDLNVINIYANKKALPYKISYFNTSFYLLVNFDHRSNLILVIKSQITNMTEKKKSVYISALFYAPLNFRLITYGKCPYYTVCDR